MQGQGNRQKVHEKLRDTRVKVKEKLKRRREYLIKKVNAEPRNSSRKKSSDRDLLRKSRNEEKKDLLLWGPQPEETTENRSGFYGKRVRVGGLEGGKSGALGACGTWWKETGKRGTRSRPFAKIATSTHNRLRKPCRRATHPVGGKGGGGRLTPPEESQLGGDTAGSGKKKKGTGARAIRNGFLCSRSMKEILKRARTKVRGKYPKKGPLALRGKKKSSRKEGED